jgi:hypothetical protein
MELRDLIVTPVVILLAYVIAYVARPWFTDDINRKYFMLALTLKILGALAVGIIYQFYYGGGDTFNYHTHGSRHIWNAIVENPLTGVQLLFADGSNVPPRGTYVHASKIAFFSDPSSYAVVKISALLDLFTFSAYSATAVLFALISFGGMWLLFLTFYEEHPDLHRWIAAATLFIPSVFFWGSGLLKDTITLSALGIATYSISKLFVHRQFRLINILLLLSSLYIIFAIKKYILLCYLPAALVWVSAGSFFRIRSRLLQVLAVPVFVSITIAMAYYAVVKIGEDDRKYSIDKIATTARVTAYDIGFYTGRDAGSSYSLGELDGTFSGMVRLAPQAINVSLFRPYLWEARNPLMLLSALESFMMLSLTLYVIVKMKTRLFGALRDPNTIFCLVFSVTFGFAVGVSTFNFGTLTRYKIPLMPFYMLALTFLLHHYSNSDMNDAAEEETE